jgi:hypothetical protein
MNHPRAGTYVSTEVIDLGPVGDMPFVGGYTLELVDWLAWAESTRDAPEQSPLDTEEP